MTNTKKTKRALLSSVLALFLCFAMLLGTTFAWFTDSVTSANNIITAGNLNIELYHTNDNDTNQKVDGNTKLFDDIALWEPGAVVYETFDIKNEGNLALKYQLSVNVSNATENANGDTLADVLMIGVIENGAESTARKDLIEAIDTWSSLASFTLPGELEAKQDGDTDFPTDTYTVVIYWMPGVNDDDFNMKNGEAPLTVDIGVTLIATQLSSEKDSVDEKYDEDAWMEGMQIFSASDLQAAINAGETNLVLMDDIELDETIKVTAPTTYAMRRALNGTVLDLNGNNITSKGVTAIEVIACVATITDTVGGGKIVNDGGNSAIEVGAGSTLYFEDGIIESTADGIYDVGGESANTIVINGGSISAQGLAVAVGGYLTINGGTLTGYQALYAWDDAEVAVTGGTFNGGFGGSTKTVVTGGTFTDEGVSNFVADGLKAIKHNSKFVVVSDGVDNIIVTADDLVALGGTAINGTYMLMADLDMTGYDMKPIQLTSGADQTLTFIGNGHTISNLNLVQDYQNGMYVAGMFNVLHNGKELTINNLTLSNVTSTSEHYAAAVVAYNSTSLTINLNNVDVVGATVTAETVAALVSYSTGAVNLTDYDVSGLALTGEAGRPDKVGALIGTANQANCTVTVAKCTNNTAYNWAGRVINGATMTIDGVAYVTDIKGFNKEVENGATHILLASGEYGVIDVRVGRKLTIEAMDGAVVKLAGINGQSNDNTSDITIKGITIDNSLQSEGWFTGTAQNIKPCVGVWGGDYTFEDCTFFVTGESNAETGVMSWWTTDAGTMTFKKCTFNGGNSSARAMQIYGNYDLNVEECTFNTAKDYSIKYVGADGRKATLTGNKVYNTVNFVQAGSAPYAGKNYTIEFKNNILADEINNVFVDNDENQTIIIDGKKYVYNADSLAKAVAAGETNLWLLPGEYDVKDCGGKILTINGTKDVVIKLYNDGEDGCDYAFGSAGTGVGTYTFNGVTFDTTGNTGNYKGFAYMKGIFNDCNFVGAYSLNNANDFVFNRCTFDFKNGYFWTWGAKSVTFDGCTFNGNSKTILAHGSASTVININNCTFAATEKGYTGAGDNTAVVEMDPTSTNTYTINFTGENTKTDSYAGWTRVKDGSTGHTITGLN
ncbi:MAG: hypothetical protein IJZ83_01650 [Clostridia bacterium]|nr:hypothetical protein [Clostridia bacterium]